MGWPAVGRRWQIPQTSGRAQGAGPENYATFHKLVWSGDDCRAHHVIVKMLLTLAPGQPIKFTTEKPNPEIHVVQHLRSDLGASRILVQIRGKECRKAMIDEKR